MEKLNYVDSVPEYISNFIRANEGNIKKIINNEQNNRGEGIIYIDTDLKENRLDLVFLTNEEAINTLQFSEDFLKNTKMKDKTSIIINDNEM